jgi:hypothetical protein
MPQGTPLSSDVCTRTARERILHHHRWHSERGKAQLRHSRTIEHHHRNLPCRGNVHKPAIIAHHGIAMVQAAGSIQHGIRTTQLRSLAHALGNPLAELTLLWGADEHHLSSLPHKRPSQRNEALFGPALGCMPRARCQCDAPELPCVHPPKRRILWLPLLLR